MRPVPVPGIFCALPPEATHNIAVAVASVASWFIATSHGSALIMWRIPRKRGSVSCRANEYNLFWEAKYPSRRLQDADRGRNLYGVFDVKRFSLASAPFLPFRVSSFG